MNKSLGLLAVVVVIVVVAFFVFGGSSSTPEVNEATSSVGENTTHIVSYQDRGYSPDVLTVNVGDTVTFKNETFDRVWTASANHPTHTVYPGTDIKKCGTESTQEGIFDQCRASDNGEEWSFTFDEVGEWGYHNHVRSSHFGKIIVK